MKTEAAESNAAENLDEEIRRLEVELASERLETCVYAVGDCVRSALMTETSCALLNGSWIDRTGRTAEVVAAEIASHVSTLQRKLASDRAQPTELGTCAFAAGGKACKAEMSVEQCDLIAGRWFPVTLEAVGSPES